MLRLTRVVDPSEGPPPAGAPRLRLTWDERMRSRLATMTYAGTAVAIALPRGTVLRDGDVLAGDDGSRVVVEAASQPLARVTAAEPLLLLRALYHLAARHVPAQIEADAVLIERDPALEQIAASVGARVEHVLAPFEPEAGAYGGGHAHGAYGEPARGIGGELSIAAQRRRPGGGAKP
jgi:urease accessory protein